MVSGSRDSLGVGLEGPAKTGTGGPAVFGQVEAARAWECARPGWERWEADAHSRPKGHSTKAHWSSTEQAEAGKCLTHKGPFRAGSRTRGHRALGAERQSRGQGLEQGLTNARLVTQD